GRPPRRASDRRGSRAVHRDARSRPADAALGDLDGHRGPRDEVRRRDGQARPEPLTRSVSKMTAMVDDLLDFARGRLGGGIPVRLEEVPDLDELLRVVVDEVRGT